MILSKLILLFLLVGSAYGKGQKNTGVTYDGRSLIINGKRELVFSGSIHYPRSPPEEWARLINKAKQGGLNAIDTYVFWNLHEPVEGQFNFEGNRDLVKFLKTIQAAGLWVILRIGPYVEAEWNYGGLPYWLREVPGIKFRTNNEPFKYHMQKWTKRVVKMMKEEKLYASQGGPIVLSQIENEYNNVQAMFFDQAPLYVNWAGNMALSMNTGVPWVMCKQWDAPGPVINSCNGRYCGDSFSGPNMQNKPSLWTENWTAQYRSFGDAPSQRSAEDLASSVARWFSRNGTLVNYYMYHGGTNYGRTSSAYVTTRYYDEAPLDEYGFVKDPKWGHLKDLHAALRLCRKALLWGTRSAVIFSNSLEIRKFEVPGTKICAAFLANNHTTNDATVTFNGKQYHLPRKSISILPDCKTVVFSTVKILAQHNARVFDQVEEFNKESQWQMWREPVRSLVDTDIKQPKLLEQFNMTKDTTDYAWYTTSLYIEEDDLPTRQTKFSILFGKTTSHIVHFYINKVNTGFVHGQKGDKEFFFKTAVELRPGTNHIALLSATVGMPNSGGFLAYRSAGIGELGVQGLNTGTLDLSFNDWGFKVGLEGEKLHIFTQGGSHRVPWSPPQGNVPLAWYKRYFDSPPGDGSLALDMSSMGKGMIWVNGHSLGRYWVSFKNPVGKPIQTEYHIPRVFVKPTDNLLVVFEELGGNPERITLLIPNRDIICSVIKEDYPPTVSSWERRNSHIKAVVDDMTPTANLKCPKHKIIKEIQFASFGNPDGVCGSFTSGSCDARAARSVAEKACLGKSKCEIPVIAAKFGANNCPPEILKTFSVQALCAHK